MDKIVEQNLLQALKQIKEYMARSGSADSSECYNALYIFVLLRRIDCILTPISDKVNSFYGQNKDLLSEEDLEKHLFELTGYSFYNVSGKTLTDVISDQKNTAINLQWYIKGFNKEVLDILNILNFQNIIDSLNRSFLLPSTIDTISKVQLGNNVVSNIEVWKLYSLINSMIEVRVASFDPFTTPLSVCSLMSRILFSLDEAKFKTSKSSYTLYDPACGTAGLEYVAKDNFQDLCKKNGSNSSIELYGQDISYKSGALAKSIALLSGEKVSNFKIGDSLFSDNFEGEKFDYIISNFPWGVSWKYATKEIFQNPKFNIGIPARSDSSMLFIEDIISKMSPSGSKVCFITSQAALTSGDFGSGENSIRTYLFDNDMVECIIALPTMLYPYTNIETYLWVLTNKKEKNRKGKVQLIDARNIYHQSQSNKSLKEFSADDIKQIESLYTHFRDYDNSKILDNSDFGELCLTIEQPERVGKENYASDRCGKLVYKDGKLVADKRREFTEIIPLNEDADSYFGQKILPNIDEEAWIDYSQTRIGYKVNFKKFYFNKMTFSLRDAQDRLKSTQKEVVELNEKLSKENVFKKLSEVKAETYETKLKYLCHFLSGKSIAFSEYVADGYSYYLQPKDIIDGEINYETCHQISKETFKSKRPVVLKDGDLVVSITGTIGKTIFFNEVEKPVVMGSGLVRISPNMEFGYSQLYIKEILSSNILKEYSSIVNNGITTPKLTLKELSNLTFRLPKNEEQQNEIAEILDNHDMLIKQLNKALKEEQDALKEYREALFSKVLDNKKD